MKRSPRFPLCLALPFLRRVAGFFLLLSVGVHDPAGAAEPPTLQERLDALRGSPPGTVLKLDAGAIYRLPATGLIVKNLENVEIDGQGATLLATSTEAFGLHVINCRNVRFHSFRLDYDPLPFTQATVTAVDPARRQFEFQLHDGYPDLRTRTVGPGESVALLPRIYLFESERHRWKDGTPSYAAAALESTGSRTGRVTLVPWSREKDAASIQPGDRIVLLTLEKDAIRIDGSEGIQWEDITIHSSPYVAFLLRSNTDSGTLRRVRITPGPIPAGATQPRLMSCNADGFNSGYARRGPVIEDCEFGFHGDDSVNLHGGLMAVVEWIDDNVCRVILRTRMNRVDLLARKDDEIRFLRAPGYGIEQTRRIEAIERVESLEERGRWVDLARKIWGLNDAPPTAQNITVLQIRLQPHTAPRPDLAELFVDIPAINNPGYMIRNNHFHDHNARGIVLQAGEGKVAGNRFERIKQAAIGIGPFYSHWREAGWVSDVVIENNIIRDVCQSPITRFANSRILGAITVMPWVDPRTPPVAVPPGNRNITIRDNVIEGCPVDAIHVSGVAEVGLSGNRIRDVATLPGEEKSVAGRDYGLSVGTGITVIPPATNLPPSRAAKKFSVVKDVPYLDEDRSEKLDVYLPDASYQRPLPAVLLIHGGGWAIGDKADERERNIGSTLAAAGYAVFSINYVLEKSEVDPATQKKIMRRVWPQNFYDCKSALRFIKRDAARFGIDPRRVAVMGGSAGGHLAMLVGVTANEEAMNRGGLYHEQDNQVRCIVNLYGIHDVRKFQPAHFAGPTPEETERNLDAASPYTYFTDATPPFLILHGDADKTVSVEMSRDLARQLEAKGIPHEYVEVPGAPHTFHLQPKEQDLRPVVLQFLAKYLAHP